MEPFHAITNVPGRSGVILAWVTPLTILALMALIASVAHVWGDPGVMAALGGFTWVALAMGMSLCMKVLTHEEIFIDHRELLVRRRLGRRVSERAVHLAPDARAHVGADTRLKTGPGSFTAIRLPMAGGKDYIFGSGLNTSGQEDLASRINAYFRQSGGPE